MSNDSSKPATSVYSGAFDCLFVLLVSFVAEAAHFSWQQGRHVICADSVQYVDGAEAILNGSPSAHFGFRKVGYSLVLAATSLVFGNMGWGAVLVNHIFQGLLPALAYLMGRVLHGRFAGFAGAMLVLARLQSEHRAERIMSEAVYTTLLTGAVVLLALALNRQRRFGWLVGAGALMGLAWLTRSIAATSIAASSIGLVWCLRRTPMRALTASLAFLIPIAACVAIECAVNQRFAGQFRTSTGSMGTALLIRMRAFVGAEFPPSETVRECLTLLPERDSKDAYLVNTLDGWVAWHRAIHDRGMSEWQADALMRKAAIETAMANPQATLAAFGQVFVRSLLRQSGPPALGNVDEIRKSPILLPPFAENSQRSADRWYAYWALPRRSPAESEALVARMEHAAETKAPFGTGRFWQYLRWISLTPSVKDATRTVAGLASIWPGFVLIAACMLGLNRPLCLLLGLAYVLDALAVGATAFAQSDMDRFAYAWLPCDTALVAAGFAALLTKVRALMRSEQRRSRADRTNPLTKLKHGVHAAAQGNQPG